MINIPPPLKGLSISIPIIIPIKGKGFIDQGLGLQHLGPKTLLVGFLDPLGKLGCVAKG